MTSGSFDPRLDPRLSVLAETMHTSLATAPRSRTELLDLLATPAARAKHQAETAWLETLDNTVLAPLEGLSITSTTCVSEPDGNTINLTLTRPDTDEMLPCVFYIHGGGMARYSTLAGVFRSWTRLISHQGVAVVAVDFRNSLEPSSVPEVAPFPAGLNDCVSGLRWVHEHAPELAIDEHRIIVAGESGGGNLTIALGMRLLREGDLTRIRGLYASCPLIAGRWPQTRFPSSIENDRILIDAVGMNQSAMGYGLDAPVDADPLAWPTFATEDDLRGLVPTVINVYECDPLRDEGIDLYRLLLRAGVAARCRQVMGGVHASELFSSLVPDISLDVAADIARFCRTIGA